MRNRTAGGPSPKTARPTQRRHGADVQRVSKIMAQRGMCSRREAERLIDMGQVEVDGKLITQQGVKVSLNARLFCEMAASAIWMIRLRVFSTNRGAF